MSKNNLLKIFILTFLTTLFFVNLLSSIWAIVLALFFFFLLFVYYTYFQNRLSTIICLLWIVLATTISCFHTYIYETKSNYVKDLTNWFNSENIIELSIERKYSQTDSSTTYSAKLLTYNWHIIDKNVKFLYSLWWEVDLDYWQILSSYWVFSDFYNFSDDFDYINFMMSKWYLFRFYWFNYDYIWKKDLSLIRSYSESIRNLFIDTIKNIYPKQEAYLLSWILIWARESFSKEFETAYIDSWLMHFMAVSWYNVTIIILFLSWMFIFLPRNLKLLLIPFIVFVFWFLVWDTPSVTRACIMWILWFFIIEGWRRVDFLTLILLTGFLMSFFNPFSISYDVSFHLSFLAVLSILYLYPIIYDKLYFLSSYKFLRESIAISFSAMIFTLPISIVFFWQFSVVWFISNIFVALLIPFSMLYWFIWVVSEYVWIFSWYFNYVSFLFLKSINSIAYFFSGLSFSSVNVNVYWFKNVFLLCYYLLLFIIIYKLKKHPKVFN